MEPAPKISYWQRKANTWVTLAVLAGGLLVGCLLGFMYKVQNSTPENNASLEEDQFFLKLKEKGIN